MSGLLDRCALCGKVKPQRELEPARVNGVPVGKVCRTCAKEKLGVEMPKRGERR